MSQHEWLQKQVGRLEREIRLSAVFESETPATREEIEQLVRLTVIHRFLEQQLQRLEPVVERWRPLPFAGQFQSSSRVSLSL